MSVDNRMIFWLSKAGVVTLLTGELRFPNGIGFSPDEKTLHVSDADAKHPRWLAFEVKADGMLGAARVFADGAGWVANGPGVADGLEVDAAGNVFGTGPGGIYVFSPRGELLGRIATGVKTANLEWGDDGSTLYITADTTIRRVRLHQGEGLLGPNRVTARAAASSKERTDWRRNVMALCPLCGVEASLAHVEIDRLNLELITRDHPEWKREDGSCPGCLSYYEDLAVVGAVGVDLDLEVENA